MLTITHRVAVVTTWLLPFMAFSAQPAQKNEMARYLSSAEAAARRGMPVSFDDAQPTLERFGKADDQSVINALPAITAASVNPDVTVRRLAASALYMAARTDRRELLDSGTTALTALIIDPDIPVRRMTAIALTNLPLRQNSAIIPRLRDFLSRKDAVNEVGAGYAGLLLRAAPNDALSINAIVLYMQRNDQTIDSRALMLQSIRVAQSHDQSVGRVVAAYSDDANEHLAIDAIQTLQAMGSAVLEANSLHLLRLSTDPNLGPDVRQAAVSALSRLQR